MCTEHPIKGDLRKMKTYMKTTFAIFAVALMVFAATVPMVTVFTAEDVAANAGANKEFAGANVELFEIGSDLSNLIYYEENGGHPKDKGTSLNVKVGPGETDVYTNSDFISLGNGYYMNINDGTMLRCGQIPGYLSFYTDAQLTDFYGLPQIQISYPFADVDVNRLDVTISVEHNGLVYSNEVELDYSGTAHFKEEYRDTSLVSYTVDSETVTKIRTEGAHSVNIANLGDGYHFSDHMDLLPCQAVGSFDVSLIATQGLDVMTFEKTVSTIDAGVTISGTVKDLKGTVIAEAEIKGFLDEIPEEEVNADPIQFGTTDKDGKYSITFAKNTHVIFTSIGTGYSSLAPVDDDDNPVALMDFGSLLANKTQNFNAEEGTLIIKATSDDGKTILNVTQVKAEWIYETRTGSSAPYDYTTTEASLSVEGYTNGKINGIASYAVTSTNVDGVVKFIYSLPNDARSAEAKAASTITPAMYISIVPDQTTCTTNTNAIATDKSLNDNVAKIAGNNAYKIIKTDSLSSSAVTLKSLDKTFVVKTQSKNNVDVRLSSIADWWYEVKTVNESSTTWSLSSTVPTSPAWTDGTIIDKTNGVWLYTLPKASASSNDPTVTVTPYLYVKLDTPSYYTFEVKTPEPDKSVNAQTSLNPCQKFVSTSSLSSGTTLKVDDDVFKITGSITADFGDDPTALPVVTGTDAADTALVTYNKSTKTCTYELLYKKDSVTTVSATLNGVPLVCTLNNAASISYPALTANITNVNFYDPVDINDVSVTYCVVLPSYATEGKVVEFYYTINDVEGYREVKAVGETGGIFKGMTVAKLTLTAPFGSEVEVEAFSDEYIIPEFNGEWIVEAYSYEYTPAFRLMYTSTVDDESVSKPVANESITFLYRADTEDIEDILLPMTLKSDARGFITVPPVVGDKFVIFDKNTVYDPSGQGTIFCKDEGRCNIIFLKNDGTYVDGKALLGGTLAPCYDSIYGLYYDADAKLLGYDEPSPSPVDYVKVKFVYKCGSEILSENTANVAVGTTVTISKLSFDNYKFVGFVDATGKAVTDADSASYTALKSDMADGVTLTAVYDYVAPAKDNGIDSTTLILGIIAIVIAVIAVAYVIIQTVRKN